MAELERLTPIFDLLRRRSPELTADFAERYPELKNALKGQRVLGETKSLAPNDAAATELGKAALVEAKADLNEVLRVLNRRATVLARLRLAAGLISSVSSAGMIVAFVGSSPKAQIITAVIAFAASLLGLFGVYIEDFSGGEGSTHRLRDLMAAQVRRLAEIEGQFRLALVVSDSSKI